MATRSRVQSKSNNVKKSNYKKTNNKNVSAKKKVVKKKRRRIKFKVVFLFLMIIVCFGIIISGLLARPITNIYISGNKNLSDQEIIDIAKLSNYPSTFHNMTSVIEKRLEKNINIKNASVRKKWFTRVYIEVEENIPLFFNSANNKTVLLDNREVDDELSCVTLINYVPDTIYTKFLNEMKKINSEVLDRMSEIKYDPNEVDDERFLILMSDNNYVYLTLSKFNNINNYVNIIKNFDSKKGILYLDSGEYFEILDN